jgi:hypothetical protein
MDKNFVQVAFGNGKGYKLSNSRMRDRIIDKLEKYYRLILFKPFGKTYNRARNDNDIKDILDYEHLASYKIRTEHAYLYLTEYNGMALCCYIQKPETGGALTITCTIQRFKKELFLKDHLFEGYLLDDMFLVEDIVIHDGCTITVNLENRIKLINDILDYKYRPDPVLDTHRVVLKDYVEYKYLKSFLSDYQQDLSYSSEIDGVVFSPLGKCVVHIIIDDETKLKNQTSMSVVKSASSKSESRCQLIDNPKKTSGCFMVKETNKPDVYELYLKDHGKLKYYDIASVPDKETSGMLLKMFKNNRHEALIMVCTYDKHSHIKRWKPSIVSSRKVPDSWELMSL